MATFEFIIVESKGAVGIITLNRPKMLNALSFGVFREIAAAVDDLEADDRSRQRLCARWRLRACDDVRHHHRLRHR